MDMIISISFLPGSDLVSERQHIENTASVFEWNFLVHFCVFLWCCDLITLKCSYVQLKYSHRFLFYQLELKILKKFLRDSNIWQERERVSERRREEGNKGEGKWEREGGSEQTRIANRDIEKETEMRRRDTKRQRMIDKQTEKKEKQVGRDKDINRFQKVEYDSKDPEDWIERVRRGRSYAPTLFCVSSRSRWSLSGLFFGLPEVCGLITSQQNLRLLLGLIMALFFL